MEIVLMYMLRNISMYHVEIVSEAVHRSEGGTAKFDLIIIFRK